MRLYYALGKGLLGIFVGLVSLFHPTPLPKPEAAVLTPVQTLPSASIKKIAPVAQDIRTNSSATTSTSTSTSSTENATKSGYMWIYLNYPEKISISPAKTIDENFQKVFNYSIQSQPAISLQNIESVSDKKSIFDSIVNVFCTVQSGSTIKAVTGSGVIVDPRGIVLTNAHVGEFPLLEGNSIAKNMKCSIRTGSPANTSYAVTPLFVSSDWIDQNYSNISQSNFSETGENDIALLQMIDKKTGKAPSKSFTYAKPSSTNPSVGQTITIASYPADILATQGINAALKLKQEQLSINNAFSFSSGATADLIETSDSSTAEHGSSGGAILDSNNNLAGLIVITVNGSGTSEKRVRALSVHYIDSILSKNLGFDLSTITNQNEATLESNFVLAKSSLIQELSAGSAASFFNF